jgi:glycyl-tRNA synthetase beta chain
VIQTLLENHLHLDLVQMLKRAYAQVQSMAGVNEGETLSLIQGFMIQRFKGVLLDKNIRYDVIDAILEAKDPLVDLEDAWQRIEVLRELTQDMVSLKLLYEPANRIGRILGEAYQPHIELSDVNTTLFRDPSEEVLFEAVGKIQEDKAYGELVSDLVQISPYVETFFNQVLINDPEESIKQNRYNLLSLLNRLYLRLANFQKLVC